MKSYMVYVCDTCGKESRSGDEISLCEATHLGLTVEQKSQYDYLKAMVNRWSGVVSRNNNGHTRDAYDAAVTRQLAFEVAHGLSSG